MALRDSKTNQSKNKRFENMKTIINPEWMKQLNKTKPNGKRSATNEEVEFIKLSVKKGLTTKSIAGIMGISVNRVKYLRSII